MCVWAFDLCDLLCLLLFVFHGRHGRMHHSQALRRFCGDESSVLLGVEHWDWRYDTYNFRKVNLLTPIGLIDRIA